MTVSESSRVRFRIKQQGMTVAGTDNEASIMHYAMMYREEGDLTVQYYTGTHWKRFAFLCQWPTVEED